MSLNNIRNDMNSISLSVGAESFLMRLLGRSMLYIHGIRSQKRWKSIQIKIYNILKKAIANNLESDKFHRTRIDNYLSVMDDACKSKDNADIQMIISLTGIIFELLGRLPDYSSRRAMNRKDDYCLSGLRTFQYQQTPYQKMRTIIEASHYKPYCDHHKYEDLEEVYYSKYNGNASGFLEWYKEHYPKVYCEIF